MSGNGIQMLTSDPRSQRNLTAQHLHLWPNCSTGKLYTNALSISDEYNLYERNVCIIDSRSVSCGSRWARTEARRWAADPWSDQRLACVTRMQSSGRPNPPAGELWTARWTRSRISAPAVARTPGQCLGTQCREDDIEREVFFIIRKLYADPRLSNTPSATCTVYIVTRCQVLLQIITVLHVKV